MAEEEVTGRRSQGGGHREERRAAHRGTAVGWPLLGNFVESLFILRATEENNDQRIIILKNHLKELES